MNRHEASVFESNEAAEWPHDSMQTRVMASRRPIVCRLSSVIALVTLSAASLEAQSALVNASPWLAPRHESRPLSPASSNACQASHRPTTRAEHTNYLETSSSDDVLAFLDSLKTLAPTYTFGLLGHTTTGKDIPYIVAARPKIETPAAARASGRPIVYLNANIHGGEVEGKEAMLALLRDWACAAAPNILDSLVLVVVPNYNGDGNDRLAGQSVNRPAQNGPKRIGARSNNMGLDLNRDYIKAAAPETQAALASLNEWDPDVYVDLHATNGSYHGYALTYSPPLTPAAPLESYTRELLCVLRTRMRDRYQYETFDYGNFDRDRSLLDTLKAGWFTFDSRPRYGTNYVGLRGRIAILSETYSHDPFQRRVASTSAFVAELLSLVAERRAEIADRIRTVGEHPAVEIPIRTTLTTTPESTVVRVEVLERTPVSSGDHEPGLPLNVRRTGRILEQIMPVYDRFLPSYTVQRPAGYLVPASGSLALALLARHGITWDSVKIGRQFSGVQQFTINNVMPAGGSPQGPREVRVSGRWADDAPYTVANEMVYVSASQRLGTLAVFLLEPESEDGLATWNMFPGALRTGQQYPVFRVLRP